jgi:hypothetical protein
MKNMNRRCFVRHSAVLAAGALLPLPAAAQYGVVHELSGEVMLNGQPMARNSAITAGQRITTGASGRVWFTIAGDAYFVRPGSELRLEPAFGRETLFNVLRLVSGALGATFRPGARRTVHAQTVTIGVRGTGIYLETTPAETYACTCFGSTELMAPGSGSMMQAVAVTAESHVARRIAGTRVEAAPFERHTNEEISRLERLVGRPNPFQR